MATITDSLKIPTADAANKETLLEEARTIKAEAKALLKMASKPSVEEVVTLVQKTQSVLSTASILVQKVYGQQSDWETPFNTVFAAMIELYLQLAEQWCCYDFDKFYCFGFYCYMFLAVVVSPFFILLFVTYFITYIFVQIFGSSTGQRLSSGGGDACMDNLLTCQYDSMLLAIIPKLIESVEKFG